MAAIEAEREARRRAQIRAQAAGSLTIGTMAMVIPGVWLRSATLRDPRNDDRWVDPDTGAEVGELAYREGVVVQVLSILDEDTGELLRSFRCRRFDGRRPPPAFVLSEAEVGEILPPNPAGTIDLARRLAGAFASAKGHILDSRQSSWLHDAEVLAAAAVGIR